MNDDNNDHINPSILTVFKSDYRNLTTFTLIISLILGIVSSAIFVLLPTFYKAVFMAICFIWIFIGAVISAVMVNYWGKEQEKFSPFSTNYILLYGPGEWMSYFWLIAVISGISLICNKVEWVFRFFNKVEK